MREAAQRPKRRDHSESSERHRAVAEMSVKAADVPQTIASQTQSVAAHSHAVLAYIRGILTDLRGSRVSIGHNHLGERSSIKDRTPAPSIVVAQGMQREALARIEP